MMLFYLCICLFVWLERGFAIRNFIRQITFFPRSCSPRYSCAEVFQLLNLMYRVVSTTAGPTSDSSSCHIDRGYSGIRSPAPERGHPRPDFSPLLRQASHFPWSLIISGDNHSPRPSEQHPVSVFSLEFDLIISMAIDCTQTHITRTNCVKHSAMHKLQGFIQLSNV